MLSEFGLGLYTVLLLFIDKFLTGFQTLVVILFCFYTAIRSDL